MAEMAGILEKFLATKRHELHQKKVVKALWQLESEASIYQGKKFSDALKKAEINIIAEIKYRSPSRGRFPISLSPLEVAGQYQESGAAAISVLTDMEHFAGQLRYLEEIHKSEVIIPLLRKDFIIDPYQVYEAAKAGASAFLLVAACLDPEALVSLTNLGESLGMEALVEVHNEEELAMVLDAGSKIIGVNNRNLDTLEVDLNTSFRLAERMKNCEGKILVSESGISSREQIEQLQAVGYNAFLVGSSMMNSGEPGKKLAELIGAENVD